MTPVESLASVGAEEVDPDKDSQPDQVPNARLIEL
jgi:hypothetical protein